MRIKGRVLDLELYRDRDKEKDKRSSHSPGRSNIYSHERGEKHLSISSIISSRFSHSHHDNSPEAEARETKKIQQILSHLGIELPNPFENVRDVLRGRYAEGDVDKALDLLIMHDEAAMGILKGVDPRTKMLGAENNGKVTCYLDALLFALFARLDSFEAMLYNIFDDEPRRRMSTIMRLFVNMLRLGKLVTSDIIQLLQDSIADCGWKEAGTVTQQDVSEAFTFITEKLDLPLLTLKMDVAHGGKEATEDDHRFVSERLLNLAIPDAPNGVPVKLESCLEAYFSNRIEVRRELERRATLDSLDSRKSYNEKGWGEPKAESSHVETVDLGSNPSTPITPVSVRAPALILRRATSAFNKSKGDEKGKEDEKSKGNAKGKGEEKTEEATVPAWCFFSVLPFYTEGLPTENSSVAQHFATKRPVIGLCLKRYAWTERGMPIRKATKVDIPLEIPLPQFVSDDDMGASSQVYGNFKLVLKSAVCHRGQSVSSGHYIALVRGDGNPQGDDGRWIRFDDLANERVSYVDYQKAFDEETPYLLFYQVTPIDEEESVFVFPTAAETAAASIAAAAAGGSGRSSWSSLGDVTAGEKKSGVPEIFTDDGEEDVRTPPPRYEYEYTITPPLGSGTRPRSSGYLEPGAAERRGRESGRSSFDSFRRRGGESRRSGSISRRRLWKNSSKDSLDLDVAGRGSSSAVGGGGGLSGLWNLSYSRPRASMDEGPRVTIEGQEKKVKRASMPTLSILTGKRSMEWRKEREKEKERDKEREREKQKEKERGREDKEREKERSNERIEAEERQADVAGELRHKRSIGKGGGSPTWPSMRWSLKKDKDKDKDKEKDKDKARGIEKDRNGSPPTSQQQTQPRTSSSNSSLTGSSNENLPASGSSIGGLKSRPNSSPAKATDEGRGGGGSVYTALTKGSESIITVPTLASSITNASGSLIGLVDAAGVGGGGIPIPQGQGSSSSQGQKQSSAASLSWKRLSKMVDNINWRDKEKGREKERGKAVRGREKELERMAREGGGGGIAN